MLELVGAWGWGWGLGELRALLWGRPHVDVGIFCTFEVFIALKWRADSQHWQPRFYFLDLLLSFTQPNSVSSGFSMESPPAFLKLSVPRCAGNGSALLWEYVHVLVIIAARCMTTNLLMWKQRLVCSCPINASVLCFLAVYPAAAFVQSCLFFLCVLSINLLTPCYFFFPWF